MWHGTPRSVLDELAAQPLLSACGRNEVKAVANLGTRVPVRGDSVIMEQGRVGSEFCVLVAGHAHCLIDDRPVAVFGVGDFFGEMALLAGGRRHATVITEGPAELLVLDRREFHHLLDAAPTAAARITTASAARERANRLASTETWSLV
jgi:CPA1 family monovalent cation:H+ antiporter